MHTCRQRWLRGIVEGSSGCSPRSVNGSVGTRRVRIPGAISRQIGRQTVGWMPRASRLAHEGQVMSGWCLTVRKQQVLGSNPSVGSSDLNSEASHEAGFLNVCGGLTSTPSPRAPARRTRRRYPPAVRLVREMTDTRGDVRFRRDPCPAHLPLHRLDLGHGAGPPRGWRSAAGSGPLARARVSH